MKFKITGAIKDSGKDVVIEIEAKNEGEAKNIVNQKGILINKIEYYKTTVDAPFEKDDSTPMFLGNMHKQSILNKSQIRILIVDFLIIFVLLCFPPWKGIEWNTNSNFLKDFNYNYYYNYNDNNWQNLPFTKDDTTGNFVDKWGSDINNWDEGLWIPKKKDFVGFHFLLSDKEKDYYSLFFPPSGALAKADLGLHCGVLKIYAKAQNELKFKENLSELSQSKIKRYNIQNINYHLLFILAIIIIGLDIGIIFLKKRTTFHLIRKAKNEI